MTALAQWLRSGAEAHLRGMLSPGSPDTATKRNVSKGNLAKTAPLDPSDDFRDPARIASNASHVSQASHFSALSARAAAAASGLFSRMGGAAYADGEDIVPASGHTFLHAQHVLSDCSESHDFDLV